MKIEKRGNCVLVEQSKSHGCLIMGFVQKVHIFEHTYEPKHFYPMIVNVVCETTDHVIDEFV